VEVFQLFSVKRRHITAAGHALLVSQVLSHRSLTCTQVRQTEFVGLILAAEIADGIEPAHLYNVILPPGKLETTERRLHWSFW
jgi:hypothetical protein